MRLRTKNLKKMAHKIEDLEFKDASDEEQLRTRAIFEDLKTKAQNGELLTEHEKDFFCQGVKLSKLDDGKIEDYDCCGNFKFKYTYLSYFHDLTGFGSYQKVRGTELHSPQRPEIENDFKFLESNASQWNTTISKTNHSNELLQQISKETRSDLKTIEKNKGRLLFRRDKEKYVLNKRATLLQSKYIYCMALQIFEMFDKQEFIIQLNRIDIEINEFSIIHIVNRHYSEITKSNPTKSFHNEDFEPRYLNKQLAVIFKQIDESDVYQGHSINKIAFKYNNVDYQIWINERDKQVKGKGILKYNRLETFYPITDRSELLKLNTDFDLKKINDDLSVYIKKQE